LLGGSTGLSAASAALDSGERPGGGASQPAVRSPAGGCPQSGPTRPKAGGNHPRRRLVRETRREKETNELRFGGAKGFVMHRRVLGHWMGLDGLDWAKP